MTPGMTIAKHLILVIGLGLLAAGCGKVARAAQPVNGDGGPVLGTWNDSGTTAIRDAGVPLRDAPVNPGPKPSTPNAPAAPKR